MTTTITNLFIGVIRLCIKPLVLSLSIASIGLSQSPCTLSNFTSSYTIKATDYPYYSAGSGVTVSVVNVGVPTLSNTSYSCNGQLFATASPAFWVNAAAPTQSLTFNFSEPVCTFSIVVNGTNLGEEFYFTPATGSVQLTDFCTTGFATTNGGTSLIDTQSSATGTLITVNNPTGATSYVLTHNGTGSGSRYSLIDCFVVCSPLPVELASFDVNCEDDEASLNWTTAAEINNDYFTIWRSEDGESFESIARVDGQMNSDQLTQYSYIDKHLFNFPIYYRLSQTDLNGETEILQSKVFYGCNIDNPIIRTLQSDMIKIEGKSIRSVSVYDQMGRVLLTEENDNYSESILLDPTVGKGIYIVKVIQQDGNSTTNKIFLEK